jgi:hypothetical protein
MTWQEPPPIFLLGPTPPPEKRYLYNAFGIHRGFGKAAAEYYRNKEQAMTTQVKVGDTVLFSRRLDEIPIRTVVTKVTPKGWIRVAEKPDVSFRPNKYGNVGWTDREKHGSYSASVYPLEQEEKLIQAVNEQQQAQKEREENRRIEREKIEQKRQGEIATVKTAMQNDLEKHTLYKEVLPNGSRLYLLSVPVRKEGGEANKFNRALVTFYEEKDWGDDKVVTRMRLSWITGADSGSASVMGAETVANDTEGLWEAARHVYYHW